MRKLANKPKIVLDELDPFQNNVVQPPPPPPGHIPNAIPPLMPPSLNSSHRIESSGGIVPPHRRQSLSPKRTSLLQPPGFSNMDQMSSETDWSQNSRFGGGVDRPSQYSDEDMGKEEINDFASDWGVDSGDSYNNESNNYDRSGHREEYSNALTKLRGQKNMPGDPTHDKQPSSMLSALEKLRNFNKRGFNDTEQQFGNKKFKFGNQDGPWFGKPNNSGYDEFSKNEQDDINSTINLAPMPFRKNNEDSFLNQAAQNNRWNSNNLNRGVQGNFNRFDRTTPEDRFMGPRSFDRTTPEGPGSFDRTTPESRFMGPGSFDRVTPEDRFMSPGSFGRTIHDGRFMGSGSFDRTTPEGRFKGPRTNSPLNDNNTNQLEPGEEKDEPINYRNVPDKDLLPILLKRNITTKCERLYLEDLVQQWIGIISVDYDRLADQFKRNLADRRSDRNRRLDDLVDLGTLYADFRLNMKVYDLTSGEEKSVFSSFKSDGNSMFKCEICSLTVNAKKNLETHFMGKKHGNKLSEYSIVGMCYFF